MTSSKPRVCYEFEVEKIIGISDDGNYQVQWAPAWVSKFHLVGCEHLIQEFIQRADESISCELQKATSQENTTEVTNIQGQHSHEPNSTEAVSTQNFSKLSDFHSTSNCELSKTNSTSIDNQTFQSCNKLTREDKTCSGVFSGDAVSVNDLTMSSQIPQLNDSEAVEKSTLCDLDGNIHHQYELEVKPETTNHIESVVDDANVEEYTVDDLGGVQPESYQQCFVPSFVTHIKTEKMDLEEDRDAALESLQEVHTELLEPQRARNENYRCERCNQVFTTRQSKHRHLKICGGGMNAPGHVCEICQVYTSTRKDTLLRHTRSCVRKSRTEHRCDVCGKVFAFASHLARHYSTHKNKGGESSVCNSLQQGSDMLAEPLCTDFAGSSSSA